MALSQGLGLPVPADAMPECSDACESMAGWSQVLCNQVPAIMTLLYWIIAGVFVFHAPRLIINWLNVSSSRFVVVFAADFRVPRMSRERLMQRDIFREFGMRPITRMKTCRYQGKEGTRDRLRALHWSESQNNALDASAGIAIEQSFDPAGLGDTGAQEMLDCQQKLSVG